MIDWNLPLVRKDNGARVYVHSVEDGFRNGDHGRMVLVQDFKGLKAPFYPDGTPIGHWHSIENEDAGKVVKTRLALLLMARARDLMDLEDLAGDLTAETVDRWAQW